MATRLYTANTVPPITPAFDGGWEVTTGATTTQLSTNSADFNSGGTSAFPGTSGSGVANDDVLSGQILYGPLAAQTISGTLKGQIGARAASGLTDARAQLMAKVVSGDGLTVRGTLLAMDTAALSSEFNIDPTVRINRKFPRGGAASLTPVVAQAGDYVVIEVGHRNHGTNTGAVRIANASVGPWTGDNPEDETTQTDSTSATPNLRHWFEFSQDLVTQATLSVSDSFGTVDSVTDRQFSTSDAFDTDDSVTARGFNTSDAFSVAESAASVSQNTFVGVTDSFTIGESVSIEVGEIIGRVHVGRWDDSSNPKYSISKEIISYEHISDSENRPNVVGVDGNLDSWTEYDRDDLLVRDKAIIKYLDLPELKSAGEVQARALEELRAGRRTNSPGGVCVWQPWFQLKDTVFWFDPELNRYTAKIEGMRVEANYGQSPYQRSSLDLGNLLICGSDEDLIYIAQDGFDRTESGVGFGMSVLGGTWQTY